MSSGQPVPLELTTDLAHGGRWTSLRSGRREWLWRNPAVPDGARDRVRPNDPFLDAGGAEECWPTVRGRPDHGAVWSRPWTGTSAGSAVEVPGFGGLQRKIRSGSSLEVGYRFAGPPGTHFLHAVHLLLELSPAAWIEVPEAGQVRLLDGDVPAVPWPSGLDRFGPDDQTAVSVLIPDCHRATVVDGADRLRMDWDAPTASGSCSLLIWRNLGGWPTGSPYRSIGIEPMVGRAADLSTAGSESAVLDRSGAFAWSVRLTAESTAESLAGSSDQVA